MENKTIKDFSELVAAKDGAPGGGAVIASVGALAASLGQMVTNLTIGKPKYVMHTVELEDIRKELELIRTLMLDGINKDIEALDPLSKMYSANKNDPNYQNNMENCLRNAVVPPLMVLKYACRIIDLDKRLSVIGSKIVVSDAATSVMLAHGILYGAYIYILVNVNLMKDKEYGDKLIKEAIELLDEYSVTALNVYDDICKRLTDNG